MNYPMVNNCLTFKHNRDNTYIVTNYLNDEVITVDSDIVDYLVQLDGYTHPYDIDPSLEPVFVDELLDKFREDGLIRESLLYKAGTGTYLFALHIFHVSRKRTNEVRPARIMCFFLSWFILSSWLPLLIFGVFRFLNGSFNIDNLMFGMVIGTIIGAFLHEASHLISGQAYGALIFEAGLMISHFVVPGAYVLMDQTPVKKKLRLAQINAAGIEMNLLLAGVFFLIASLTYEFSGLFFGCALANVFLGLLNTITVFGMDGEHILANLIGDDNFAVKSKITIFEKKERALLRKRGINGRAVIAASYIMGFSQIALPILIIVNIIGVALWFK